MDEQSYSFTITGKIIPAVRMTQRGKFVKPRAQAYLASQEAIRWQIKQQMMAKEWEMLPERTPLKVRISLWVAKRMHGADLDNLIKAVEDSAQGIVFKNDLWIDSIVSARVIGAVDSCVLTIGVI